MLLYTEHGGRGGGGGEGRYEASPSAENVRKENVRKEDVITYPINFSCF